MLTIFFDEKCFSDIESSLYLMISPISERACDREFIDAALDYLILDDRIFAEYKTRDFTKATDNDIALMRSIIENMKSSVRFDFEDVIECYTMNPEDCFEHMMMLKTAGSYIMLYWNTTA